MSHAMFVGHSAYAGISELVDVQGLSCVAQRVIYDALQFPT